MRRAGFPTPEVSAWYVTTSKRIKWNEFLPSLTAVLWCQGRKKSTKRAPLPGGDWLLVKLALRCQPGLSFPGARYLPFIILAVLLFKSQPSPTFHPQKLSKEHLFSQEYFRYLADNLILWERHWLLQSGGQTLIAGRQAPLIFLALQIYY